MRRPSLLLLILLLPFLTAVDAEAGDPGTVRTSTHFRVICHFEAGNLADEALETLEALWPIAAAFYGLEDRLPPTPLAVHIYRNRKGYEEAELRLIGGSLKRNLAFAHYGSRSAHVAVQPDVSDSTLAALGLPYLTRLMVAHEAAHLIRFFALANHRQHPGWFKDGSALWLKRRTVEAMHLSAGLENDPTSATSIRRVQRLIEKGKLPTVEQILLDGLRDLTFYERYDAKGLLFEFLSRKPYAPVLPHLVPDLLRMKSDKSLTALLAARLRKGVGQRDYARIDKDFRAFVRKLKPAWEESIRSLETAGMDWEQVGWDKENAVAWRTQAVDAVPYTLRARLHVLEGGRQQMNVLLDRTASGFVSVAFTAGWGVTIFSYDGDRDRWTKVDAAESKRLPVGHTEAVGVRVDGTTVSVSIGGEAVLTTQLPGRTMTGAWGLGAQHHSAGIWSNVVLERAQPRKPNAK